MEKDTTFFKATTNNDVRSSGLFHTLRLGLSERLSDFITFTRDRSGDLAQVQRICRGTPSLLQDANFHRAFQDVLMRLSPAEDQTPLELIYLIEMPTFLQQQGWLKAKAKESLWQFAKLSQAEITHILDGGRSVGYFDQTHPDVTASNPRSALPEGGAKNLTRPQLLLLYVVELDALARELGHDSAERLLERAAAAEKDLVSALTKDDPEDKRILAQFPRGFYARFLVGTLYATFMKREMGQDLPFVVPPHIPIDLSAG